MAHPLWEWGGVYPDGLIISPIHRPYVSHFWYKRCTRSTKDELLVGKGLDSVHRSIGSVKILTYVQKRDVQEVLKMSCGWGMDWVQCTETLNPLRSWHVYKNCTRVKISMSPVLLCIGPKLLPCGCSIDQLIATINSMNQIEGDDDN